MSVSAAGAHVASTEAARRPRSLASVLFLVIIVGAELGWLMLLVYLAFRLLVPSA